MRVDIRLDTLLDTPPGMDKWFAVRLLRRQAPHFAYAIRLRPAHDLHVGRGPASPPGTRPRTRCASTVRALATNTGRGHPGLDGMRRCGFNTRRLRSALRRLECVGAKTCAQIAQLVEQGTENPRVGSSILSLGTIPLSAFRHSPEFRYWRSPHTVLSGRTHSPGGARPVKCACL